MRLHRVQMSIPDKRDTLDTDTLEIQHIIEKYFAKSYLLSLL